MARRWPGQPGPNRLITGLSGLWRAPFKKRDPTFQVFDSLEKAAGELTKGLNLLATRKVHIRHQTVGLRAHQRPRLFSSRSSQAGRPRHHPRQIVHERISGLHMRLHGGPQGLSRYV